MVSSLIIMIKYGYAPDPVWAKLDYGTGDKWYGFLPSFWSEIMGYLLHWMKYPIE